VSRVFENPFYAWSEQKAWSEEKAPPCGLELVGGMLFQSEPSQFFHRSVLFMEWLDFRFTWTPGAHVSGFCRV
jgi:hypothetical protein